MLRDCCLTGLVVMVVGCLAVAGYGFPPPDITIQGTLESAGSAPPPGPYEFQLDFYDNPASATTIASITGMVEITDGGRFSIEFGFGPAMMQAPEVFYQLAIDVAGDGIDASDEFPEKVRMLSVPYARQAASAEMLGGSPAGEFVTMPLLMGELSQKSDIWHNHDGLYWSMSGNVVAPTEDIFLGTVNDASLELRVGGVPAMRLIPNGYSPPNVVAGWHENNAVGGVNGAVVSGGGEPGRANLATDNFSTVSGGAGNEAAGPYSVVGGGTGNTASGLASAVLSGSTNNVTHSNAVIVGGINNEARGILSTIGGGSQNKTLAQNSVVAGGGINSASGIYSVIGGGANNTASGQTAVIGGGEMNVASGVASVIAGGFSNMADGETSTIGGGIGNYAKELDTTIAGGHSNIVNGKGGTIGGGIYHSTVGEYATIAGGYNNIAGGTVSAIIGGELNQAMGEHSVVPGGLSNQATGTYSFAAGRRAKARHNGAFVWADSTNADFPSSVTNEFAIRANGGVRMEAGTTDKALLTVKNLTRGPAAHFDSQSGHSITTTQPSLLAGPNPKQVALLRWYKANTTRKTFGTGTTPSGVAFDGANMWIVNYNADSVTVLQANNGSSVATYSGVGLNYPQDIAFDGMNMWITNRGGGNLTVLRADTGAQASFSPIALAGGATPFNLAFDGTYMWVTDNTNVQLDAYAGDGSQAPFAPVNLAGAPRGIAFDGTYIWACCVGASTEEVNIVRAADGVMSATIATGYPHDVVFDGARMWVSNLSSNTLSAYNVADYSLEMTVITGNSPTYLAFDGRNVWAVIEGDNSVSVIRARDGAIIKTVNIGGPADGIAFDGANMWLSMKNTDNVMKM